MEYQPYLGWGLNNFEDVISAFTKFKDGGWWIRKIDYKDAFNREITEGPYKEKEAKTKAEAWNNLFKFKNLTTAKAYSFQELVCNHNKDYKYLEDYLFEEYIWRPPRGAELFCIIKGQKKVLMFMDNKYDKNLEKFKLYVLDNGVKLIKKNQYNIFYKDNSYMALEQAKKLEKLVENFKGNREELIWLYDQALKNPHCRGLEPILIPQYIRNFNYDTKPYSLDFFKKLKGDKIKMLIENLKCSKRVITFPQKDKETLAYKFPFLYDERDYLIKNFVISYTDEKLIIEIKEEPYHLKLVYRKGRAAILTYELPFEKEKLNDIFNFRLINLALFICKILEIEEVILKDNLKEFCRCEEKFKAPIYLNIIRFLNGQGSVYDEIGFVEQNQEKREDVINEFRWKTVGNFFGTEEEGDLFYEQTVGDLARNYLDGMCDFSYICDLLAKISAKIFDSLKDCCFEYHLDLRQVKLIKLRESLD